MEASDRPIFGMKFEYALRLIGDPLHVWKCGLEKNLLKVTMRAMGEAARRMLAARFEMTPSNKIYMWAGFEDHGLRARLTNHGSFNGHDSRIVTQQMLIMARGLIPDFRMLQWVRLARAIKVMQTKMAWTEFEEGKAVWTALNEILNALVGDPDLRNKEKVHHLSAHMLMVRDLYIEDRPEWERRRGMLGKQGSRPYPAGIGTAVVAHTATVGKVRIPPWAGQTSTGTWFNWARLGQLVWRAGLWGCPRGLVDMGLKAEHLVGGQDVARAWRGRAPRMGPWYIQRDLANCGPIGEYSAETAEHMHAQLRRDAAHTSQRREVGEAVTERLSVRNTLSALGNGLCDVMGNTIAPNFERLLKETPALQDILRGEHLVQHRPSGGVSGQDDCDIDPHLLLQQIHLPMTTPIQWCDKVLAGGHYLMKGKPVRYGGEPQYGQIVAIFNTSPRDSWVALKPFQEKAVTAEIKGQALAHFKRQRGDPDNEGSLFLHGLQTYSLEERIVTVRSNQIEGAVRMAHDCVLAQCEMEPYEKEKESSKVNGETEPDGKEYYKVNHTTGNWWILNE
ncbi:hypothetical protein PAPYR_11726 [Paratrimastix pyriformis]|uniref:Uncharacterized protein n=1 Tax=Paratrimastix pyriformis TaxID=342808 RepID=A0ABQ8U384_9EUKA|nr:hypothetical protein PAPYR_11726 [Paratrimastix pyriformis]